MSLHYTPTGYLYLSAEDDPAAIARAMVETGYGEEFCIAQDFSPEFTARLAAAGFLVMSTAIEAPVTPTAPDRTAGDGPPPEYLLLPKLHLERALIFFENFHEPRSARRLIPRYELRTNLQSSIIEDTGLFDTVMEGCAAVHGNDWLTPPLMASLRQIGARHLCRPVAFGLYREGRLVAGEFGIAAGRVYTSYSGYYEEDSAGTVQLILTGRYLRDAGFAFWDLGMPMAYKTRLGAQGVERGEFLEQWQKAGN
jgi:Leu/Phe-tRNA-protein transferase